MTETPANSAKPISLLPKPEVPKLPGTVVVSDTVEELVEQMSLDLLSHSLNCVRTFGDFQLALCGGQTPIPLYRHLMIDPVCRGIPWRKTHLWLVDEYAAPDDSENANWAVIADFLTEHSGIPRSQQHPIDTAAKHACEKYEAELRRVLEWREKGHDRLDYVLLGMDAQGGIAGLLSNQAKPSGRDRKRLVTTLDSTTHEPDDGPNHPPKSMHREHLLQQRVTMTHRLLNSARFVAIMVTGASKCGIVEKLVADRPYATGRARKDSVDPAYPILDINPMAGSLRWYLDYQACPTSS